MTFGEYIRDRRIALNLSLAAASKKANISSVDWSKMERDVNCAPTVRATKIAIHTTLNLVDEFGSDYWRGEQESWMTKAPIVTEKDIDEAMPIFTRLTDEQRIALRPLIKESLTRNESF